jgi:methyl-accepting chemotaxis protein
MQLSFRNKLFLPLVISWLCLLAVEGYDVLHNRALRLEERKAQLSNATDVAMSVIKEYGALAESGKLPADVAKKQALERIKAMRYGSSGYFTILDSHVVLMHPIKPELVGTDVTLNKDPKGTLVYMDALKTVHDNGSGFTSFLWPKPGEKEPIQKLSFDSLYKPWDWTSMSGLYMDDLDKAFYKDLLQAGILLALLGFGLTAIVMLTIRSIEKSVGGDPEDARRIAEEIAEGDLRSTVKVRPNDNGSIVAAMSRMQANLVHTIGTIQSSAGEIATAASEISQGNHDLSSRTEQQASSLGETASAMEQLTSTVKQNEDNAGQANEMAKSSSEQASRAGEAVAAVSETMNAINASSKKIADIIGVVDGIAFQTNILALNAAVEAARAGEQGRGFAVVAAEVRTLAQRSASAAKDIKHLVEESVGNVQSGTRLVQGAADTMKEVVVSARKVADIIGEIRQASIEQSSGIEQVNIAIASMDQATQQNAALVEQAAAAAESMRDQAAAMANVVDTFKVNSAALPVQRSAARVAITPRRTLPSPKKIAA